MSILRRAASAVLEQRTNTGQPWGDSTPPPNSMLGGMAAGVSVSDRSAIGIGAVWSCVGVLTDAVATLPVRQFEGRGPNRKEMDPSPVIADPWSEGTRLDFLVGGTAAIALRGNAVGRVVSRDDRLYPTQIQPVANDAVRVRRSRKTGEIEWTVGSESVPADDIFHVRGLCRFGGLLGLNPIEEMRITFALAIAQEAYGAAYFQNSANPSGVISTEEDLDDDETLSLARAWIAAHQGIGKAYLPAVLTRGATWQQVSINPADAAWIEARNLSRTDVASIFRVPPHLIGDVEKSTSFGRGIEQQERGFVNGALGGYISRWEHALSGLLPKGQYVEFDLRRRLRGDSVQRSAVIVALRNAGILSADESRDLYEDLPPIPDGKGTSYLQPLNMGEAGAPVSVPDPSGSS